MSNPKETIDIWREIAKARRSKSSVEAEISRKKVQQILLEIARERKILEEKQIRIKEIDDRLAIQENEYNEIMKAQEIIDQIDEGQ